MKKIRKVKKGKRKLTIVTILCTLFVINLTKLCFSSIVSDSDGTAFITKQEFHALKNSFSNQINEYNESIDNKIDGAIAQYLAGISLSKTDDRNQLCYDENGILCVRGRSDLAWVEGTMKWNGMLETTHQSSNIAGWTKFKFPGGTVSPFRSLGIKKYDKVGNKWALWEGRVENNQYLQIASDEIKTTALSWDGSGGRIFLLKTWPSLSNMDVNPGATKNIQASWSGVDCSAVLTNLVATRVVKKTEFQNIIISKDSISESRFEWVDMVNDFSNDTVLTDHKCNPNQSSGGGTITLSYKKTDESSNKLSTTISWNTDTSNKTYWPYIGFTSRITNYNKLATTKYDSLIGKILGYYTSTTVYQDEDNVKHLPISAGAPIVELKRDETLILPIEFKDKTVNYDVYLKMGPFTNGKTANAETGLVKAQDVGAVQGDNEYAIRIKNGQGTIKYTANEKGIVFMKWTLAGNSCAGGGLYLPKKNVNVVLAN